MSLYEKLSTRLLEGEFNYAFSISLRHKYVFVENAKAACTALKSILGAWEFSGVDLGPDIPAIFFGNVHVNVLGTPFVKPFQLGRAQFNSALVSRSFRKIAFVRNPYTRLLSAYLDKIGLRRAESDHILREASDLGFGDENGDITFVEFLRCVRSIADRGELLDKHWRPQSFQMYLEKINYDLIGRVEDFDSDIDRLGKLLRINTPLVDAKGHQTGASEKVRELYSDEAQDLILGLYRSDFESFGYSEKLPTS